MQKPGAQHQSRSKYVNCDLLKILNILKKLKNHSSVISAMNYSGERCQGQCQIKKIPNASVSKDDPSDLSPALGVEVGQFYGRHLKICVIFSVFYAQRK